MPENVKVLIVVMAIALVIFSVARPIAIRFSAESDFARRRNVWFVLTITAFLSPNFWLYAMLAIPLFVWAGRKDSNPVAFYLLLIHVIPALPVEIPTVGIERLFPLDNYRLLSFCVLVPTAWRLRRSRGDDRSSKITSMDCLLLAFGFLQILLYVPADLPGHVILPDSATNLLRRAVLFFIDVYVLYYVVSRSCSTRRAIVEAQAAFCLACALMAVQGVFEGLRHWLLYTDMAMQWGAPLHAGFYAVREGILRAQASSGSYLAMGYLMAIATAFWLYLQSQVPSRLRRFAGFLVFWAGLLATFSRGPLVGALAIYLAFTAIGPGALPRTLKAVGIVVFVVALFSLTPVGEKIINSLPFFGGTTNHASVIYRERLADRSWALIQQHPLLGDQLAITEMEDLRQGEGIIDLVNTYATVALFYGAIGWFLFIGFILVALVASYRRVKRTAHSDPDFSRLGASLVAGIIGILVMIGNCSFILGIPIMFYVLAGFAAAYLRLGEPLAPYSNDSSARIRLTQAR